LKKLVKTVLNKSALTKTQSILIAAVLIVAVAFGAYPYLSPPPPPPPPTKTLTPRELWMSNAKLGPYAPATDDWNEIISKAKQEGKVVVYSLSSRIPDVAAAFKKRFPEIEVEAYDISDVVIKEKLTREQESQNYQADVLFYADYPTVVNMVIPKGYAVNWVPTNMTSVIPEKWRTPALVHSMEARTILYNNETYTQQPITSIWDLTKKEWKGKVMMKDPLASSDVMNWLALLTEPSVAKQLTDDYQRVFGQPLKLTTANAGYEFISMLKKNDVVLTQADGDVSDAVGARGQKNPPLGICVVSKMRDVKNKKLAMEAIYNLTPFAGVYKRNILNIANMAKHPWAAKLFITFMLHWNGYNSGYWVPGQYSPRSDLPLPPASPPLDKTTLIEVEKYSDFIYTTAVVVRDKWIGG